MRGKIIFVVGLATGYVLGTRAGRERYEQIKAGAEKVWNTPTVQAGVHTVQDFAGARVDEVKATLSRKARNALAALIGREPLASPQRGSSSGPVAAAGRSSASGAPKPSAAAKTSPAAKKPAAKRSASSSSTASTASASDE
ncbi:YtxH domain-containing protein [Herbiconiux sp. KACC 21604]|uniref:YtxH domain-containing protein n=1 Tax=unclassified Herbiconiux TaxID=2618217 RepID=UPI0020A32540|nr:YtxH domain-containing protein [Herbiconiux sp. SALV-R1]WPO86700.1 YtxH domain-containing protein [Herbiconiux sp. KACC 21604]